MNKLQPIFIGADVGTQGVRAMALNGTGELLSLHSRPFAGVVSRQEQSPQEWWEQLLICLKGVGSDLKRQQTNPPVSGLSVTSTSGTMIALDKAYRPVSGALMYSDTRSEAEACLCREAAAGYHGGGFTTFHSSSNLPKIVWYTRHCPEETSRIALWAHAADYLLGRLSGVWGITDYTTALKTGYDYRKEGWPDYIGAKLGLPYSWFPRVVSPGTVIGHLTEEVSEATGLPQKLPVVAGMTDGCSSQISSGAISPGSWNTTIGTTMVIKGVTRKPLSDPLGRVYNHKHPQGYWMPGGASNTGADWVSLDYGMEDVERMNQAASAITPSPWIAYPLRQRGERFPFVSVSAAGFEPEGLTPVQRFTARLEGVAYLERLCYEVIEKLSAEKAASIYTAGGASQSEVWLRLRSHVLQKPILKMKHTGGAAGAAILAASGTYYSHLEEAGRAMTRHEAVTEPENLAHMQRYDEQYKCFVDKLQTAGYLDGLENKNKE